jgi:DNA repair protein RecN (Recombination protein N)
MPREGSVALRELRISNLAVIEEARLSFEDGFSVLTGETGSGKSMCVNALRAALGGRIEPEVVRAGTTGARVAAVFDNPNPRLRARRAELGIPDDDLVTLSREVPASGRATCRVDGALVSQAVLREIGDLCVEVTAQGTSQRMLRRSWQRDVLDTYGGTDLAAARIATAGAVRAWRSAVDALAAAHRAASTGAAELQRARDLIEDLGDLAIAPGEDAELQAERLRLRHAARIASSALSIAEASGGDDRSAADRLASAAAEGADLATVDPALAALIESADELVDRLRDLALDARRHAGEITVDEMRLTALEERLDVLTRVTRRHGSLDAALLELERATSLVASVDGEGGAIELLESAAATRRTEAGAAAAALSAARSAAARRLERAITGELHALELPHARFRVVLSRNLDVDGVDTGDGTPVRCGPAGVDDVDFRLAANRDSVPMPLDEGPSGGELGRLALALSAVVSEEDAPVLVLDEVDTGIGGETAARVGDVLARIGRSRQVVAITHRPEIAARAGSHLTITKRDRAGGADARAAIVAGDERVREIARLMSGRTTDAALTRAAELLEEGSRSDRGTPSLRTM